MWGSTRVRRVLLLRGLYSRGVTVRHSLTPQHQCSSVCLELSALTSVLLRQTINGEITLWPTPGSVQVCGGAGYPATGESNYSWQSALCHSYTDLLPLEGLIRPRLQVCPYLWLLIQLSDSSPYLFCDRKKQGPNIRLEFEGCVLNLELKGQAKDVDFNMQGV